MARDNKRAPGVGAVVGRSREDMESLRDQILGDARDAIDELAAETTDENFVRPELKERPLSGPLPSVNEEGKKLRNHKIFINYFHAMDDIIADSYEKQKAAYEITRAVGQLFESRGQNVPFDDTRFERAASNLSMVQMIREMAWLFGIDSEHVDLIVSHTIDRLFGPPVKR